MTDPTLPDDQEATAAIIHEWAHRLRRQPDALLLDGTLDAIAFGITDLAAVAEIAEKVAAHYEAYIAEPHRDHAYWLGTRPDGSIDHKPMTMAAAHIIWPGHNFDARRTW